MNELARFGTTQYMFQFDWELVLFTCIAGHDETDALLIYFLNLIKKKTALRI